LESRRRFLRCLTFSAIGAGLFLAGDGLTEVVSISHSEESAGRVSLSTPLRGEISNVGVTFLSVKVVYLQMAQYISTGDEYFVLQSPATLRNLLNNIAERHPSLTMMMTNMWILINGAPSNPNASLKDGDEVDLVPLVAGG